MKIVRLLLLAVLCAGLVACDPPDPNPTVVALKATPTPYVFVVPTPNVHVADPIMGDNPVSKLYWWLMCLDPSSKVCPENP